MWSISRIARLTAAAAGLALVAAPAYAQPPDRRGGPRDLEAEVNRLRVQVTELRAEVAQLRALLAELRTERKDGGRLGEDRKDGVRPPGRGFGPGGLGRPGPEQMREMRERFESKQGGREFGPPGPGFGRPSPEQRERLEVMPRGRESGTPGRPAAFAKPADRSAEVLERLDRLAREIDELRRLVRQ
jgi:hypothetical protein